MPGDSAPCRFAPRGALAVALVVLVGAAGCFVQVPLTGKACDEIHPCVDGFVCQSGICLTSSDAAPPADAGREDAGGEEPSPDAGGEPDAGDVDAGQFDGGSVDAGQADSGSDDAGDVDAGQFDGGSDDAGPSDGGPIDGALDAGVLDAGPPDGGGLEVAPGEWWDLAWPYRVDVTFKVGASARQDYPVDVALNLPALMTAAGVGPFDERSVRVVEHDATGKVLAERPSYFSFDAVSGEGIVFFALRGVTPAGGERRFGIYFADGSDKPAPPYWQARVQPVTENSVLELAGMGHAADGTLSGLSLKTFEDFVGGDTIYHRAAKILSSDGDYGSSTGDNGRDPAPGVFGVERRATRRLLLGGDQLFETVVNAGSLRLREFTWLGRERILRHLLRVENTGAQHVAGVRYFIVIDTDLDESEDDTAAYVEADDIVYASDPTRAVAKVVGIRAAQPSAGHSVGEVHTVFDQVRAGTLPGTNAATGDIATAASWALPDLPPGASATLRHQLAFADSYELLRTALLDYAAVPAMTLSELLVPGPQLAPSGPPQIIDFVASPSLQLGEPAVFVWTTRAASACTLTGPGYDGAVPTRGSLAVVPTVSFDEDASFTLRCSGGGGADAQSVRVVPVLDLYRVHSAADLGPLAGLSYVGELEVLYSELSDLSVLSALTTVGEDLALEDNHSLTSLAGLENLSTIGDDLYIADNPSLPTCAVDELLLHVTISGGTTVEDTDDNGTCAP